MAARQPKHPIGSVDNALKLLLMFRHRRRIRVSEAGVALGVASSTAHRLMAMLEHHGLVEQDPETRAYQYGPTLAEVALSVVSQMDGRATVHPYLERLSAEVDETVHYVVLDGTDTLFVDGVECVRPVRSSLRVGARRPAHCTSGGKALLARLPDDEIRARYKGVELKRCTAKSIRGLTSLLRELERVRRDGYGLSIGESEPEIAAIGVAIPARQGRPLGAFSVSMPMTRYDERQLQRLGLTALSVAEEAARELSQLAELSSFS